MILVAPTHPWINFRPDLSNAPISLWLGLGRVSSKCEYIKGVPLKPVVAEKLSELYLAKGVLATTAIEGNTLTEDQVREILRNQLKLPASQEYLAQEVKNVLDACNDVVFELSREQPPPLTVQELESFNHKILKDLPLEDGKVIGKIRENNVGVGRYLAPNAQYCRELLEEFCDWYNNFEKDLSLDDVSAAVLKAILAHLYFVWIHPFDDGNGRTARLIELKTLLSFKLPVPVAHLLSNHYNFTRAEYYRQLDRASKTGDCLGFVSYALQGFLDKLDEQIDLIRFQQLCIAWKELVYDYFAGKDSPSDVRRRHLVLDMSFNTEGPVPKTKIKSISTRLAEAYATKTDKTLTRDLNELRKLNLISKTPTGYVANKGMIMAFLPITPSTIA